MKLICIIGRFCNKYKVLKLREEDCHKLVKQKIVKTKTKRINIKFDKSYINEVNFIKHKGYCDMKELYQKSRKDLKRVIL